jgi:hypothetical protein
MLNHQSSIQNRNCQSADVAKSAQLSDRFRIKFHVAGSARRQGAGLPGMQGNTEIVN